MMVNEDAASNYLRRLVKSVIPAGLVISQALLIAFFLFFLALSLDSPSANPFQETLRTALWTPRHDWTESSRDEYSRNSSDLAKASCSDSLAPLGDSGDHSVRNETEAGARPVHVFYHIYIGNGQNRSDVDHAYSIVKDQQAALRGSGLEQSASAVHYTVVGSKWQELVLEPSTVYQKSASSAAEGSEMLTLQLLWEHCTQRPSDKVLYIHSKGSFHRRPQNELFRRALMRSLLDPCCLTAISSSLSWEEWEGLDSADLGLFKDMGSGLHDVCGMRFCPAPHFHIPGNMWWARCDYIRRLVAPSRFQDVMGKLARAVHRPSLPWVIGTDRYSSEHWVTSHPSVRVVDNLPLGSSSGNTTFTWGYGRIPDAAARQWQPVCSRAFRTEIPLEDVIRNPFAGPKAPLPSARWKEYAALYGNGSLLLENQDAGAHKGEPQETTTACLFFGRMVSILENPISLARLGPAGEGFHGWLDDYKNATVRLKCQQ